jgi:hypothetical protein
MAALVLGSVLLSVLLGCGPRAAVQVNSGAEPTPDCRPTLVFQPASTTPVPGPSTSRIAVAQATAVATAPAGTGPAGSPVARAQLVAEAVATATAAAHLPTPTSPPTPSPGQTPGRTACPAPTGAAAVARPPGLPSPAATLIAPTVLLASDVNRLILLHPGDRVILLLGDYANYDWHVELSDASVLQRVSDDGQGVYLATRPGETQLIAVASPICLKLRPACGAPSRMLYFTIRVSAPTP